MAIAKLGYSDLSGGLELRWRFLPRTAAVVSGEYWKRLPQNSTLGAKPSGWRVWAGAAGLVGLLPFVLIMVIFYFLIIRPQQQRQKQHALMLKELKKGDRILTSGGLFATVLNVKDDRIVATIADDVKVEIGKQFVQAVVEKS